MCLTKLIKQETLEKYEIVIKKRNVVKYEIVIKKHNVSAVFKRVMI